MKSKQAWQIILRRIAAFVTDYFIIILPYIILLAIVNVMSLGIGRISTLSINPINGQIIGFFSVTLPVALYFIILETWRGSTIGKQMLGLHVQTMLGGKPTLGACIVRNALKFIPWEIAHWAIWGSFGQETVAPIYIAGFVASYTLLGIFVLSMIFSASRRTLYDRVAGLIIAHKVESVLSTE